jgi:hypothetical protein
MSASPVVVVRAPGPGPGHWAGAPSAALDDDGAVVLAYRLRDPGHRGGAVVIARAPDGERFTTLAVLERDRFAAASLERPALVRTEGGGWRIYISCATPGTRHWRIDALDAADPAALAAAPAETVLPGDERTGVKDPVVRRRGREWVAWVCCHPLDVAGEEDRMTTALATSADGLAWSALRTVLVPRSGAWDARGTRVTAPLDGGRVAYDGRASREENFSERTGIADARGDGALVATGDGPVADFRYLDSLELPGGGRRLFYEAPLPDGSHELRTEPRVL